MNQAVENVGIYQYKTQRWQGIETGVIVEQPVSLTVNGEVWMTFMCSPTQLEAMAVGFLFNEDLVQSMADVASVRVCPAGDNIDIWLNYTVDNSRPWRRTSGCTGGATTTEVETSEFNIPHTIQLTPDAIGRLVSDLLEEQQYYREVGGVHTSAISDGEQIFFSAEDIGRHNTLDKLAGKCLIENTFPAAPIVLTTGRISSEMMQKAARLNAEVVISRTSPTSMSIQLARRWGITLVGYARRDRFMVYSCPERIHVDNLVGLTHPENGNSNQNIEG